MKGGSSDAGSVKRPGMADVFGMPRKKMLFLFDCGDEWRFVIEALAVDEKAPTTRYPRIVASVGKAPKQQYRDDDDQFFFAGAGARAACRAMIPSLILS